MGQVASKSKADFVLPPDIAILIEARLKAGEKSLQIKPIANLILHDPVLTLEFLQYSNSVMFGGAAVTDIEAAVTRLGTEKLTTVLTELHTLGQSFESESMEVFEILRYNCRRISIVSLMTAAVLRPALTALARTAGLFGDIGHMIALRQLGVKYCETAKANSRQKLAYRLETDHKFDLNKQLIKYLGAKSVPRLLTIPYNLGEAPKGSTEIDLRLLVKAAMELIESYDAGKFGNYAPEKALPSQSCLRILNINPAQHQRLFKACHDYLRAVASAEAPEGTSLFISSVEPDEGQALDAPTSNASDALRIPTYPNLSINSKSREALKQFFELCEKETEEKALRRLSVEYLRTSGLFERTAILRVSPDGCNVIVENSLGLELEPGAVMQVKDNRSPFKMIRVEIKSTATKTEDPAAPFGSNAYAFGPADILPNGEKLVLYADRTASQALTMESRRVFRLALGLLMQSLQGIRSATPAP